ncbi:MAG: hypothetical protein M3Z32_06295 [Acidobacteriota bacterium]|nr:hypothetical protein [Acidobacteriota bacterium]
MKVSRDPDDHPKLAPSQRMPKLSGDGELFSLHPYREISILTPKRFLDAKLAELTQGKN